MARFDVYRNPGASAGSTPFLVEVQSDLLDGLETRVVVPLSRLDRFAKVRLPDRLAPVLRVEDEELLLETPKLGTIPRKALGDPVSSLLYEQDRITTSLDFLLQGF
jgi:toxin CcdB